jgi:long-subunit acyl-CoA synthetase (AMP-forming)
MIAKNYPGNRRVGSVGRIFPEKRVEIDGDGQIMVQSAFHANTGYWRGEGDAFARDGWVATGDIGHLDADGYLYIDGRVKELIVLSNGHKISPRAIEEHLRSHPGIADCVVISPAGAHLVAAIETVDPALPDTAVAAILAALATTVPAHWRVLDFVRLDRLSFENGFRTANGKLKRGAVADYHARMRAEAHD